MDSTQETKPATAKQDEDSVAEEGMSNNDKDEEIVVTEESNSNREEVEVVSPFKNSTAERNLTDEFKDDDEIQMTNSNVTNPFVSLPHPRHLCGIHKWNDNSSSSSNNNTNELFCPNCYCYVCDEPAKDCKEWKSNHCCAHENDAAWRQERGKRMRQQKEEQQIELAAKRRKENETAVENNDAPALSQNQMRLNNFFLPQNKYRRKNDENSHINELNKMNEKTRRHRSKVQDVVDLMRDSDNDSDGSTHLNRNQRSKREHDLIGSRIRAEARITDVLAHNLRMIDNTNNYSVGLRDHQVELVDEEVSIPEHPQQSNQDKNMQGDISQLSLHNSFFVEGVRIGWPYPMIMPPQRQMAIHLIKAFKNSRHVVLESPTGTGKSAAILCAALAWQRYNAKTNSETTKIIYCSRTHSQVAQMVASLRKTPYRPRMSILGSRDRLCIHKDIRPRGGSSNNTNNSMMSNAQVSNACQIRVKNTEKYRKSMFRSQYRTYDDEEPILSLPGDGGNHNNDDSEEGGNDAINEVEEDQNAWLSKNQTCSHYRQLTKMSIAKKIHESHVPNKRQTNSNCCSSGDKSKFGTHDIEDLVAFGLKPSVKHGIAIYRPEKEGSFGLRIIQSQFGNCDSSGPIRIDSITPGSAADLEGTLRLGDRLKAVNGVHISHECNISTVTKRFRESKDPLLLDVYSPEDNMMDVDDDDEEDDGYSAHAACPFYISKALAKSKATELIFAPYNYVLDPGIREAMEIDIQDAIVVLDEAHNVESTLCDMGSCQFSEFELIEMFMLLHRYASQYSPFNKLPPHKRKVDDSEDEGLLIPCIAHELMDFVEQIILFVLESRAKFENNKVPNGVVSATAEYQKYKCADDKEFEVSYFGPTGFGEKGKSVGCKSFFENVLQLDDSKGGSTRVHSLLQNLETFENYVGPKQKDDEESQKNSSVLDGIHKLVTSFCESFKLPEHFFVSSVVSANGNLEFATTGDNDRGRMVGRFRRNPKQTPLYPPPSGPNTTPVRPSCNHYSCFKEKENQFGTGVIHGKFCDGEINRWQGSIVLHLLTPGLRMNDLSKSCKSVVLASGSLAPIQSLCAELNLLPPKPKEQGLKVALPKPKAEQDSKVPIFKEYAYKGKDALKQTTTHDSKDKKEEGVRSSDPSEHISSNVESGSKQTDILSEKFGRLQVTPRPLEANHVVNLPKQLLAVSVGHFPDGTPLSVKRANYIRPGFHEKLGQSIATIARLIPRGGVLVFFPSYSFLRKCESTWRESNVWDKLLDAKGKIVVEPSGSSQSVFESARDDYNNTIRTTGSCILLAVFRGKMSEGVSFNDDYARGVICVGLPYPSMYDRSIKAKMNYNDEQRKFKHKNLLPGNEWYSQQAYRAIAQALGRCIRHAADYGTVILLDSRHCDDGSSYYNSAGISQVHSKLPKWMRHTVRNLSMQMRDTGRNDILGGWRGFEHEMRSFFQEAKIHGEGVLQSQSEALKKAQERDRKSTALTFKDGQWSQGNEKKEVETNGIASTTASCAKNSCKPHRVDVAPTPVDEMKDKNDTGDTGGVHALSSEEIRHNSTAKSVGISKVDSPMDDQTLDTKQSPSIVNDNKNNAEPSTSLYSQDAHLCIICEENAKSVVLMPCKHLCLCKPCFANNAIKDCPMCRKKIDDHIDVFI